MTVQNTHFQHQGLIYMPGAPIDRVEENPKTFIQQTNDYVLQPIFNQVMSIHPMLTMSKDSVKYLFKGAWDIFSDSESKQIALLKLGLGLGLTSITAYYYGLPILNQYFSEK